MGKWTSIKQGFGKVSQEGKFAERVQDAKRTASAQHGSNLESMVAALLDAKRAKKAISEAETDVNVLVESLTELVVEHMEATNLTGFKLKDTTSVSLRDNPYPQVVDKAALFQFFDSDPSLRILLSVNYQTLRGFVSDRLVSSEALPPGVNVFFKTSVTLRGPSAVSESEDE